MRRVRTQARSTDAIALTRRASTEQYRKRARNLIKACRSADIGAVRDWAIAWIERIAPFQWPANGRDSIRKEIAREADTVVEDVRRASLNSRPLFSKAELLIARLHGFTNWKKFANHLKALGKRGSPLAQFESAADAIVNGDTATLKRLLRKNPKLVNSRSTRVHQATLLHYVAANGHEGFRQRTPRNAVEIAKMLLEAGARVDAFANMYGHRCTTMEMLVSSVHPHAAGVQVKLAETLLDFGAAINGVEDNGSPLLTAFRFHYPKTAEALAKRGARVDNVIAAAALGRVDLVDQFVKDDGTLRPEVPLVDGPWPHLPKDPSVHLAYALTWACAFGRPGVVELLLRKGVPASAQDADATALHFAAAYGRMNLVRLLLKHGASLEMLNSYGGTVLDGTVWYALNGPIKGVDYAAVVRELIDAGARVDVYPEMKKYVDAVLAGRRGLGYSGVTG